MSRILRRSGVDDDIFFLAVYLLEQSDDAGRRFVDAVEVTLKNLAQRPGIGSRKEYQDPPLADTRSWSVEGFPNHLIYYLPLEDGIDVLAIMHAPATWSDTFRSAFNRPTSWTSPTPSSSTSKASSSS